MLPLPRYNRNTTRPILPVNVSASEVALVGLRSLVCHSHYGDPTRNPTLRLGVRVRVRPGRLRLPGRGSAAGTMAVVTVTVAAGITVSALPGLCDSVGRTSCGE